MVAHCNRPEWVIRAKCASRLERNFLYDEIYVKKTYERHGVRIEAGGNEVIVDVGANIGLFSCFSSESCNQRTLAIEPMPETYSNLCHNVGLHEEWCHRNNVPTGQVVPLCVGLGNEMNSAQKFTYYPLAQGWSTMAYLEDKNDIRRDLHAFVENALDQRSSSLPKILVQIGLWVRDFARPLLTMITHAAASIMQLGSKQVTCDVVTLSHLIETEGIDGIALLKIDVERSEVAVVQGIERNDWGKIRQLVAEVHGENLESFLEIVKENGEFGNIVCEQGGDMVGTSLHMVYATR
eukprot:jgi/Picsp_1/6371/NSC_03720-R1_amino acid adenylation domain protein